MIQIFVLILVFLIIFSTFIVIVPEQMTYIVERLGKYQKTLNPGINFIIPILDNVCYKHSLKEKVLSVPSQVCITQDNVSVTMDGVLYMVVLDPVKASYAIDNYEMAAKALAQTTMRAEIGRIDLDHSFSGRENLNKNIIVKLDEITDAWGVKVTRYEILNIIPPSSVVDSMEKQVYAERKKRAEILLSEGQRESQINLAEAEKESQINISEGEKIKRINEAEGKAKATELLADAVKEGNNMISEALEHPKAEHALLLTLQSQYLDPMGEILKKSHISILPKDLANIKGIFETINLSDLLKKEK